MISLLGSGLLILALLAAIYTLYLNVIGVRQNKDEFLAKAQLGMATVATMVTLASFCLLFALVINDFSLKYVYSYSARELPFLYKISAFWAGNAGSLLLWAQILAIVGAIVSLGMGENYKHLYGVVSSIILINLIFFLVSMLAFAHPFESLPHALGDGRGLNPMLRTPWMVIHPVAIYLGYVGWVAPFAFAMASLLLKRTDGQWISFSRNWVIFSWLFLSLGNLLGAQWAYIELGWGGYWAWDPVENASFLPWLTGTAFLHSVLMEERKGVFKVWNMALVIITYTLTLYGTFLVRSGILSSVHAFSKSNLSYWFGFFMLAMLFWSLYLLVRRRNILKSELADTAFFSKEASFFLNNLLLVGAALIVFFGTNFPIITGFLTGVERVVGQEWFNATAGPVLLSIIFLIGLCTLIPWKKARNREFYGKLTFTFFGGLAIGIILRLLGPTPLWSSIGFAVVSFVILAIAWELIALAWQGYKNKKNYAIVMKNNRGSRRKWGAHLVHLGLALFAIGVIGNAFFSVETIKTMEVGETIALKNINEYQITFQGVKGREEGVNGVIYADLLIEKNGRDWGVLTPEKIYYPNWEGPRTEVVILGGPVEDLYVVLAGWSNKGQQGVFEIHMNPLMNWLWIGGYFLIAGALLILWPTKKQQLLRV